MQTELPFPDPDALELSSRLSSRIAAEIEDAAGWMSFSRFMELALFAPGLGYYSGGARKFGPDGDFVTAPEISPLFGRALASQVQQIMESSFCEIIEVGAGTGLLACDLLSELAARDCLPQTYAILELSGELRARQAETLRERVPDLAGRVVWLDGMPDSFSGCIVANEVLDVMPVQLALWRDGSILERGVGLDESGSFVWQDRPAQGRLLASAQALPVDVPTQGEYLSEIGLAGQAWVAEWGARLVHGALILIDYGYPQAEYYLQTRSTGSLQCYYRHRAHTDVLCWPGLNDITAFVDFTAIAEAAHAAGLDVKGFVTQASFLTNCGILDLLASVGASDSSTYLRAARSALRLLGPHEMGELFKVLILGRGLEQPLLGLAEGDRTHVL